MAISKSAKIEAEIEKVKAKISEQQARLKELEQKKVEAENSEIVDIVRGMSIPLAELPVVLQQIRAGATLGQNVPKSGVGRGTRAFIYALSAGETSPALAAPRHAITALFSCRFKCPCPPWWQPHFRGNADRAYNTLHFASKVVCQGASPFGNPGQQNRLNISHFFGA